MIKNLEPSDPNPMIFSIAKASCSKSSKAAPQAQMIGPRFKLCRLHQRSILDSNPRMASTKPQYHEHSANNIIARRLESPTNLPQHD